MEIDVNALANELREKVEEKRLPFPMFGIGCGKGWEKLYGPLLQLCKLLSIEVHQVKEKYGGLRFYVGSMPTEYADMVNAFIDAMEEVSYKTCEECGIRHNHYRDGASEGAKVTTEGGWLRTLCEKCREV